MSRGPRTAPRGFTLLEVVVAIALLGAVLATGMQLLATGLRSVKASGDISQAVILARQKLGELTVRKLEPQTSEGVAGGYRWTAEIAPEEGGADGLPARLYKLRVRVSWAGRGGEKGLELVTLRTAVENPERPVTAPAPSAPRPPSGRSSTGAQRGVAR